MQRVFGEHYDAVSASFTRPSNVTAYAALDVVGGATPTNTFANAVATAGGSGMIKTARIVTDQVANTSVFRLHLFRSTPTSPPADNSPYVVRWDDRASRIGYIDFPAMATEGSTALAAETMNQAVDLPFVAANKATSIYALLETLGAWTPASAQLFLIELIFRQM